MKTTFGRFTAALALLLVLTWPGLPIAAESSSDTGVVSVEVLPPGMEPTPTPEPGQPVSTPTPEPGKPGQKPKKHKRIKTRQIEQQVGTLSAFIMWLPDPAQGQTRLHGLLAVQDHRARADGWTVRLLDASPQRVYLVDARGGEAGFDIPDWLYEGIHTWDVSMGASLAESPQIVTAPKNTGYSLTIHQLWIEVHPAMLGEAGAMVTLVLILPAAP